MTSTLNSLLDKLEDTGQSDSVEALYEAFTGWAESTGRPLYPHQEEALLELLDGNHVIAQTPTGSGKSMIALAGHFISLARGGRSYYTAPLKALVSEKFFELVDLFGAANVGMVTGDVSLNSGAPIICCTAEILANQSLREGADLDADMVIMDEFHFYADPQRGWAWQVPLLELPNPQFVALSATLGDVTELAEDITERTGRPVALVTGAQRPVPLEFEYCPDELPVVVERLLGEDKAPIYIVHFAQRDAVATASSLVTLPLLTKDQKEKLKLALAGETFGRGFGQTLRKLLLAGVGVHHAGMLPRYRRLVERLTQHGLLKVVCGTDTLGVGINVPIRTVLFTSLVKFDGRRSRHLSAREFHQIAGRAGRAGYDSVGYVRVLASEAEVEQAKHRARLTAAQEAKDAKRLRKLARKTGPKKAEKGKISWDKATFERLVAAQPEQLRPQFDVNHAMFLNVLAGPGDPEERILRLVEQNHSAEQESDPHLRKLGEIYKSLRQGDVLERLPREKAQELGTPRIRAAADLPDEFALNQPLAPFALAALDLLDPESPEATLDQVSLIESIMEDPNPVLWSQQRQARDEAFHAMKADGLEYGERQRLLDEVTWPRPLTDLIDPAFRTFAKSNPWVGYARPSPKSVLREMIESGLTFTELVSKYDLQNSEGVVLRYLSDLYRAMIQIVPDSARSEEWDQIIDWLKELVRSVDSSLLDEWEQMNEGGVDTIASAIQEERAFGAEPGEKPTYKNNAHLLRRDVGKAMFQVVEMLSFDRVEALAELGAADGWDYDRWDNALARYFAEHDWIGIDPQARSRELLSIISSPSQSDLSHYGELNTAVFGDTPPSDWWIAEQTLLDPEEHGDWRIVAAVDLGKTKEDNRVHLRILDFAPR